MKLPFRARTISTAIVIPSAIVVAALAVMEYRWSTRVSEATAVRLADSLQMSLMNWQKDFFRYFSEIGLSMRIDPVEDTPGDIAKYVRRFSEWNAVAKYPDLVSNVFLFRSDGTGQRLNVADGKFESLAWPDRFKRLRADLENASIAFSRDPAQAYGVFGSDDPSAGWSFDPDTLVLLHPVISDSPRASVSWIAIELNPVEIKGKILGDLSRTYFQGTDGLDYLVAVIGKPGQVLYTSDVGFGDPEPPDADGTIDLFGRPGQSPSGSPVRVFHVPLEDKGPDPSVRIAWFPLLHEIPQNSDWRLVVRHRRGGPLGAFVGEMRRRDLTIGFGILLVLAINMAMLIVMSHRAQKLAQMQMDFVTAVSHELRTPLTVIISGADNICSGVVATGQQVKQYGSVIGTQARQLFGLVERILLFAASRQGRLRYNLKPLDICQVVDAALASSASVIESAHATVEWQPPAELPQIAGDAEALSQCLQNLITNALKYGGRDPWIGIRATAHDHEVCISVADRGPGIAPDDLPHIFDPFYRSPSARDAQIHGTGLGLALSRSIAQAMNGKLEVTSPHGRGTTFTLHLNSGTGYPFTFSSSP